MSLAIRIILQAYFEGGKIDAFLKRRRADGTSEAVDTFSDLQILEGLIDEAGNFLDGITVGEDEKIGDSSEFEQVNDGPVPDVAFVIDVSREERGIEITTQIFTLRSDGQLHLRGPAELPDKLPVVAQMSVSADQLFRSVEEPTQTKAKWPISKTFRATNGGGGND
jgi:hypothetical protein